MHEAARNGWPVLCCDSKHRKRRRPAERAALLDSGLREFVLNGNVTAAENVLRVLDNLDAIVQACSRAGRSSTASTPSTSNCCASCLRDQANRMRHVVWYSYLPEVRLRVNGSPGAPGRSARSLAAETDEHCDVAWHRQDQQHVDPR